MPTATIGAVFGLTSCLSAQVREKPDDPLNYFLGGCAGGLTLGARSECPPAPHPSSCWAPSCPRAFACTVSSALSASLGSPGLIGPWKGEHTSLVAGEGLRGRCGLSWAGPRQAGLPLQRGQDMAVLVCLSFSISKAQRQFEQFTFPEAQL